MYCIEKIKRGKDKFFALFEKYFLYLFILIVPHLYYPLYVDGWRIDLRKIREIGFYSFAVIICSFLQKNRWLRYFIVWCVINWWLNFFIPKESYIGLTNILSALVLYLGIRYCIKTGSLKIDWILRILAFSAVFQFSWMVMQAFNYDPIFYPVTAVGAEDIGRRMHLAGWSGNPSILGVALACTSFLLLHYYKIKKIPILFFVVLSSVFFIRNATTVMCFGIAGLFYIFTKHKLKKRYLCLVILIIAICSLFFIFIDHPNLDRIPIWQKVITKFSQVRPWVGRGINFFAHLFIVDKTGTPWKEAHNDYIQLWLELGRIGFVLFIGFIISEFIQFSKKGRDNRQICIASCLVAYLMAGATLFPMHLPQLSFYAVILYACLKESYDTDSISTFNTGRFPKKIKNIRS